MSKLFASRINLLPLLHLAVAVGIIAPTAAASAAEILLWSAGAAQNPVSQLVQAYQQSSDNTVKAEYAPVGVLMQRLAAGGKPDVLIVTQDVMGEVEHNGWAVAASTTALGSVGVGVAVKEGAPLPDISTPEALRASLLKAKSITYIDPNNGTSGKHFAAVLQQLGIADQVRSKTTLGKVGFVVEPVARGEIELGIQQITEILPVKGVTLVGPLPASLQKITTYAVTMGSAASDSAAAATLIRYLKQDSAVAVFKAKGFSVP